MSVQSTCAPEFSERAQVGPQRQTWLVRIALPQTILIAISLLALTLVLQRAAGTEIAGFGGADDEAAHYVTSLLIRDYLADGLPGSPVAYAERYYLHYPKVAFGIWPPLFHLIAGVWLFLFGTHSEMTFVAILSTLFAMTVYALGRRLFDNPTGLAAAVWLLLLPGVQASSAMFMMDILCAGLMFVATVTFGLYLKTGHTRYSVAFGLIASAAIMSKYNALALALVPPLGVLAARRLDLVRRPNFWLPALLVIAICGPWYLVQADLVWYASQPYATMRETPGYAASNTISLAATVGWLIFPLVGLGCWSKVKESNRTFDGGVWAGLFGLVVAVWVFHSLLYPTAEVRYLLPASAAIVLFACAGVETLARRWLRSTFRFAALLLVLGVYVTMEFQVFAKENRGLQTTGEWLVRQGISSDTPILVASDARGEGAFVAAVAMSDQRPNAIVLRASKLLASSTWMGLDYHVLFPTSEALAAVLAAAKATHVVIDDAVVAPMPHQHQLSDYLQTSPDWTPVPGALVDTTNNLRVYRRVTPLPPGKPSIDIDMKYALGRRLVY